MEFEAKRRKKLAVIGGGQIGGTIALLAMQRRLANVVLLDVAGGVASGKALDLSHMASLAQSDVELVGGDDAKAMAGADVCIVTAGFPRQPGMSREDLLEENLEVIARVADNIKCHAPSAFVVCVTNPLDAMVYALHRLADLPRERVVGMAGVLDSARFRAFLAQELNVSRRDVTALVLGGHGDTMVPLPRFSAAGGIPLPQLVQMGLLEQERLDALTERTRKGGGEIVRLLGKGSAFYAPAQAALEMAESVLLDQRRLLPCATLLNGEYDVNGLFVGVPTILDATGVRRVIELPLNEQERAAFARSVESVQRTTREVERLLGPLWSSVENTN